MVSKILLRRYATVAAALATAVLAVLVPAAGTAAPELDRAAIVRELKAAIADEERALRLLGKSPPQMEMAALALDRSERRLLEIKEGSSLPDSIGRAVSDAILDDRIAAQVLRERRVVGDARAAIEMALREKAQAIGGLSTPASTGGSQCADGRDNDGDGTEDARYDSGCTNAKDGSERSPLTCSLGYAAHDGLSVVQGTCSGPFFKIAISAPVGAKFDTKRAPVVVQDRACWYPDERTLGCVMGDGVANPRHVVNFRWYELRAVPPARRLTVTTIDFGGGRRIFVLPLAQVPPPAEPSFSLGPEPVPGVITFTNGTGGCPVVLSFVVPNAQFFAPGDGTLTITTGKDQVAKGPIKRDGSFDVRNANETYKGKITGTTANGTYTYTTPSGCVETYDISVVL